MEYIYKDHFFVLGKLGEGEAGTPWNWIQPLWEKANGNFKEIEPFVLKNEENKPDVWGIMSDFDETFARWSEQGGKYLAGCTVKEEEKALGGWVKWEVPAQTYLVVKCTGEEYLTVFEETISKTIPEKNLKLIGAVHEHYPEPGNPSLVELYFPIARGNYFCQSCGMPMSDDGVRGTNEDKSLNADYCHYCFKDGAFSKEETMEEMIESCIPFEIEAGIYKDAESAREAMLNYFPMMKRWKV